MSDWCDGFGSCSGVCKGRKADGTRIVCDSLSITTGGCDYNQCEARAGQRECAGALWWMVRLAQRLQQRLVRGFPISRLVKAPPRRMMGTGWSATTARKSPLGVAITISAKPLKADVGSVVARFLLELPVLRKAMVHSMTILNVLPGLASVVFVVVGRVKVQNVQLRWPS